MVPMSTAPPVPSSVVVPYEAFQTADGYVVAGVVSSA